MPVFPARQVEALLNDIFVAAGTPEDIAQYISSSLVGASIRGVDSHGVMRVVWYVDEIMAGHIKPAARPKIQKETATIAIVQGNWGFGIFALGYAMDLAIGKAKRSQVAAVGLVDCSHTGRLGQFAEIAAENRVLSIITGAGLKPQVAPFGGASGVMSTNPYAIGIPGGRFGPIVADFATSSVAEGKLQVFRTKHAELPPGWIIDKDGRPSTDVEDFYAGGLLLPAAGHKGYALAIAAQFLGGILLGLPAYESNFFILAIDIESFRPFSEFAIDAEKFLHQVKTTPPAEGFDEVLLPGEPESRNVKKRTVEGVPIPDEVWQKIQKAARLVGVNPSLHDRSSAVSGE